MTESMGEEKEPALDAKALAGAARLEFGAGVVPASLDEASTTLERAGDVIGRYELVRRIGRGGMGTVWLAEQREPVQRRVALKVIKLGMDTEQVLARFAAEQQALALMEHPNIAGVLDGGATPAGRPYFVMEYVEGEAITAFCDRLELGLEERLRLFVEVTAALQHAHQKGVIHRDIKPSNVLVTELEGTPRPVVIDFGIARITGDDRPLTTRLTEEQQVIGTLEYMSPEQAGHGSDDIDTRADVYGLGALLYELLTGEPPFAVEAGSARGLTQLAEDIQRREPTRPSTKIGGRRIGGLDPRRLAAQLEGELDWIVLKALEKDRERRYPTATELGADVARFLAGDAVEARPPSRAYRLGKFVRRNRLPVIAGATVAAALVLGLIGTGFGLLRALDANETAQRELVRATEARRVMSSVLTSVAPRLARGKDTELLLAIMDDTAQRLESGEVTDPIIAADLGVDLGDGYMELGRFDAGLVAFERASAIRAREFGAEAAPTLAVERRRADALRLLERVEDAEPLYRELLPKLRATAGPGHGDTRAAERGLGHLLHRTGRIDEAHELLTGLVERERQAVPDEERARSSSHMALATLEFFGRDDREAARALLEEGLGLARAHLAPNDPQELRCLELLSMVESTLGNLDRSVELGREVCERYRAIYGPEHRDALLAEGNLGITLLQAGRPQESGEHFRELLARQSAALGEDDPDTLWTAMQVAVADARDGHHAEAVETMERIVRVKEDAGIPAFEERANLGIVLRGAGHIARSLEVFNALLPEMEAVFGPDHRLTVDLRREIELANQAAHE